MLIVGASNYTKPYIVMHVGCAKFIIQTKYNILLIIRKLDIITVYRNGTLLGQLGCYGIYTAQQTDRYAYDTEWDNYAICGTSDVLPHNVPFYKYPDGISIFGYKVTQYKYDYGKYNQLVIDIRNYVLQI